MGELLETIATKAGRLLKGGEPCIRSAAITVINDFQRGRLPHYVAPPELKEDEQKNEPSNENSGSIETEVQDLDIVGEENMKTDKTEDEENDRIEETDKAENDGVEDAGERDEPVAIAEGEWE